MATGYTSAYEMSKVAFQGVIHEDVMNELFMISPIDLPFQDMAGTESSSNPYKSWVVEKLTAPTLGNALIEGVDAVNPAPNDERRIGNQHQLSGKFVVVSDRANQVDGIGYAERLAHELMNRQKELKRDVEATLVSNQESVEMKTSTTAAAGLTAGAATMIDDANSLNGTTGVVSTSTGIWTAAAPGAAKALTETDIRSAAAIAYKAGGNPTKLMSTPDMIQKISEYLFTASARIATVMSTADVKTGRYGHQGVNAIGSVNVFTSDFCTLEMIPNQQQLTYTNVSQNVNVYLFDPRYWAVSYLQGVRTMPIARTGTAEKRQMTVDFCNMCLAPSSSAVIMGINPALAMTA